MEKTEQTIECIAKYGHLYDAETKKRIVFEKGETPCILSGVEYGKDYLFPTDPEYSGNFENPEIQKMLKIKIKNSEEMARKVAKEKGKYEKILDAKSKLYFILSGQHKFFEIILLEDLYAKKENNRYSLYECLCRTFYSDIDFFEVIYGSSLAELYRKTSVLYNGFKTSHATYILRDFFTDFAYKQNLKAKCDSVFRIAEANAKLNELEKIKDIP